MPMKALLISSAKIKTTYHQESYSISSLSEHTWVDIKLKKRIQKEEGRPSKEQKETLQSKRRWLFIQRKTKGKGNQEERKENWFSGEKTDRVKAEVTF